MLELASILGFEPSIQNILNGHYFNLETGKFEDELTAAQSSLSVYETGLLKQLFAMYYDKNELKLNATERKILLEKMILYFRWHVSDFLELKSPQILSDILK